MNEIEEVIVEIKNSGLYGNQVHPEILELALKVLQEKQERDKGCWWCNSCEGCYEEFNCPFKGEHSPETCDHYVPRFNFCHMCGRKLGD